MGRSNISQMTQSQFVAVEAKQFPHITDQCTEDTL